MLKLTLPKIPEGGKLSKSPRAKQPPKTPRGSKATQLINISADVTPIISFISEVGTSEVQTALQAEMKDYFDKAPHRLSTPTKQSTSPAKSNNFSLLSLLAYYERNHQKSKQVADQKISQLHSDALKLKGVVDHFLNNNVLKRIKKHQHQRHLDTEEKQIAVAINEYIADKKLESNSVEAVHREYVRLLFDFKTLLNQSLDSLGKLNLCEHFAKLLASLKKLQSQIDSSENEQHAGTALYANAATPVFAFGRQTSVQVSAVVTGNLSEPTAAGTTYHLAAIDDDFYDPAANTPGTAKGSELNASTSRVHNPDAKEALPLPQGATGNLDAVPAPPPPLQQPTLPPSLEQTTNTDATHAQPKLTWQLVMQELMHYHQNKGKARKLSERMFACRKTAGRTKLINKLEDWVKLEGHGTWRKNKLIEVKAEDSAAELTQSQQKALNSIMNQETERRQKAWRITNFFLRRKLQGCSAQLITNLQAQIPTQISPAVA